MERVMTQLVDPPSLTAATPLPMPMPADPAGPLSRRQFLRRAGLLATLPIAGGFYATEVEPFWARLHELPLAIGKLPATFEGYRVAHVTDMHAGFTDFAYLTRTLHRAATELRPDLVLATGDVIHHTRPWAEPAARLLGEAFVARGIPVVVSFGNHEFGYARRPGEEADDDLHVAVEAALIAHGCTVLRNASHVIERAGDQLWLVGLDDLWFGRFDPEAAFAGVPRDACRIALSHNPDTAPFLDPYGPDLILSGHTHGGQVRLPGYGAPILNVADTRHDWGLFDLPNSRLYGSSGVGYIRKVRFNCRPEVPVFRLARA
jgi:predicted MPP superfamily phosphohydrolase